MSSSSHHPTLSLALTVRSNRSPQIIAGLTPYLDEIVVILTSPTTDVREDWRRALDHLDIPYLMIDISPLTHPHLYSLDIAETFSRGEPLCGEIYSPGSFSGLQFINDWAATRNLGWQSCSMEWRLALSDNDVITQPESLPALCQHLNEQEVDVCRLLHQERTYFPAQLARCDPRIQFEGIFHEHLVGGSQSVTSLSCPMTHLYLPAETEDRLATRALYAACRRFEWIVPPDDLLYLARSSLTSMPTLATFLLNLYLQTLPSREPRAWAEALMGEVHERAGQLDEAARCYMASNTTYPGWKSALRLSRLRCQQSLWEDCLKTYCNTDTSIQYAYDDGNLDPASSLIFVASSLHQLGRAKDAQQIGSYLAEIFPHSQSMMKFCKSLEC